MSWGSCPGADCTDVHGQNATIRDGLQVFSGLSVRNPSPDVEPLSAPFGTLYCIGVYLGPHFGCHFETMFQNMDLRHQDTHPPRPCKSNSKNHVF